MFTRKLPRMVHIGIGMFILIAVISCPLPGLEQARPALAAYDYTDWDDIGIVYTDPVASAYYPSVIFDSDGFGSGSRLYKMWYSDGSGAAFVTTSVYGISWDAPVALSGLGVPADVHHVQVLYDASCFGGLPCDASSVKYKIWYWDIDANLYSIDAIAYAESSDGVSWSNDQSLTQDASAQLVTGAGVGWNRGSYGPIFLFYQAGAANSGTAPWNYSYVMYYDGTDGGAEATGLAYSDNGLNWYAYTGNPLLDKGVGPAWDCDDTAYGTVYHDAGGYHFWYSGGGGDNGSGACASGAPVDQGIGYAASSDGLSWTKDGGNPIYHISEGISYRNKRIYTPAIVDDGSGVLRMYYSAQSTDSGAPKKIGLALNAFALDTAFVDDDWVGLADLTQVTFPGDPAPHFIGVDAFPTIQGGVDAVISGGLVRIAAGNYAEQVLVNNKAVTLEGAGAGSTNLDGVSSTGRGIDVTGALGDATIHDLTITRYQDGVYAQNSGVVRLYCNDIAGNSTFGLNNTTGAPIHAMDNWWGSASGPQHSSNPGGSGDPVSDSVVFSPWKLASTAGGCTPTAVLVSGFHAVAQAGQIVIYWQTAMEQSILGFNLDRATTLMGERSRLNTTLIPGVYSGSPDDGDYVYQDPRVEPGVSYYYWLEAVERSAGGISFGPTQARTLYALYLPILLR